MSCELFLLRFSDTIENKMCSAQHVPVDIRYEDGTMWGRYSIGGQVDGHHGEYNKKANVRKVMRLDCVWWRKPPTMKIILDEYQLYDVPKGREVSKKRRHLCKSSYYFFIETEEDNIRKCRLTVQDNKGIICETKTYSQVDNVNRRFYTMQ